MENKTNDAKYKSGKVKICSGFLMLLILFPIILLFILKANKILLFSEPNEYIAALFICLLFVVSGCVIYMLVPTIVRLIKHRRLKTKYAIAFYSINSIVLFMGVRTFLKYFFNPATNVESFLSTNDMNNILNASIQSSLVIAILFIFINLCFYSE